MSKYGAIVGDPEVGVIGTSSGQASQDMAEQKATSDCKAKGGQKCELAIAYGNKCVSLVSGASFYNIQTGLTLQEAENNAMRECSDKDCRVLYSDCSDASRY
jgi:hypothetical protein